MFSGLLGSQGFVEVLQGPLGYLRVPYGYLGILGGYLGVPIVSGLLGFLSVPKKSL